MSTQVFLLNTAATTHRGDNSNLLIGVAGGWLPRATGTSRGSVAVASQSSATVAGATNGIETRDSVGWDLEWITPPVDADVTISGDITANVWASESNMSANVAINVVIDKLAAADFAITQIVKSTRTTEVAVTTRAVNNFTTGMLAADYTEVALNKGDRLRIRVFADDAGTMASGFTFNIGYNGNTAAADGDTFVTFTETFGFQTTDPTGTTVYLTDTASAVSTADVDYEAWTARGNAATSVSLGTGAGWIAPTQFQAGGTNASWFTKGLQAFTLSGLVKVNLRASQSAAGVDSSVGVQIARVDSDGTNAVIWGYANRDAAITSGAGGEIATTETAYTVYVAGDDLAISDGQRLRVRLCVDDCSQAPTASGVVEAYFDGPTGGTTGDTFLTFGQTLTEFSAGGDASVTPATISRSFAVDQAGPSAASSITPATVARSFVVDQVTARQGADVTPATISRAFLVPQVDQRAGASLTPATVARSFVMDQTGKQAGVSITPTTVARSFVIDQAIAGAFTTQTPATIARSFVVDQVDQRAGASLTPTTITRSFVVDQVTQQVGVSLTPTTISRAFVLNQAGLSAGSFITPATIARAFVLDQAGKSAGVSLTPATIARVFVIDQATPQTAGNATVSPALIARAFVLDQATPQTAGNASVTPSTIARLFVLDQTGPSAGVSLTPSTIARAFLVPQVSVQTAGNASVTPATVARAFALAQLTTNAGASLTPSTIARAFGIGQVAASGSVTPVPGVISRVFVIPQVVVMTSTSRTPAVVGLGFVVPQVGLVIEGAGVPMLATVGALLGGMASGARIIDGANDAELSGANMAGV